MIQNGTLLQERYLIERQIGAGGMGAVYLAVDQRFDSYVAIKQTFYNDDGELGEAFEREARLLNSLHHPVLPHVSDYFIESGGHFLVMQYIEGEDLFAILKREGAFPVKDVVRWTDSLLDALDYLHSQEPPIIHRDIKPHNLKITQRGDVILLDFGLAKLKSENTTGVKSVFGYSRKYSPLEQIQGTGTDARSDLFALAATAYHLLTGKPPIDVLARASEIIVGNPDPLQLVSEINSEVPAGMAHVLHTALALNAAGRFVSATAMRHALENAVSGAATSEETAVVLPEQQVPALPADVDLAAIAAAAQASENAVVISPENEEFPALEAFAANAAGSAPSPAVEIAE
ncbi:MAG: serine/threonine protein kinase, partial [Acidobacteriota bacterium]|nr:serine/threonine protein kinase [Acidobacteriota bacterium]